MKETCETLKSIRKQIAEANGIAYEPNVCTYNGPCKGTCPVCEAEAHYIEVELAKRQKAKQPIHIIGVAKDKLPAQSSFSQAIAAATITAVLSITALPVAAAEQNETDTKIEKTNLVRVTGVVNDGNGTTLYGARIGIYGSETITKSDENGNFSIDVSIGDTLGIECTGFKTEWVIIRNTENLTISLNPRGLTGAVASLTGSHTPLYVVDGKPINWEELASINPNDVVSIEVLKSAAEIAPYAEYESASYGVIVIKTKMSIKQKRRLRKQFENNKK